jgi:hypothetical protein
MERLHVVESFIGAVVLAVVLVDIFLTVLYARIGASLFSGRVSHLTWRAFRTLAPVTGRYHIAVLSACGPVILGVILVIWAFGLTLGTALIIHPALGTDVTTGNGTTPQDFVAALYAGGSSMTIVGASDFTPRTGSFRLFYLFTSFVGLAVLSLTLTFLAQVYTALQQRNTLALQIDHASNATGDAAELLARLGPQGKFEGGYSILGTIAGSMTAVKEAHHFYPALFYFRFRNPAYAVSHFTLVALDTVSLIESALDEECYGWLPKSAAVTQLQRSSLTLVTVLTDTFLPATTPEGRSASDSQTLDRWRGRYHRAISRLQQAGIRTALDTRLGAERYVTLRSEWDPLVRRLAPSMAYSIEEIDPAGQLESCQSVKGRDGHNLDVRG